MLTLSYNAQQDPSYHLQKSMIQLNRNPGCHSNHSPIVGTRADELKGIRAKIKEAPVLAELEYQLHDAPDALQNFLLIPYIYRVAADNISKEIFDHYILRYQNEGINEANAVEWHHTSEIYCGYANFSCNSKGCNLSRWEAHAHVVVHREHHEFHQQENDRYTSHYLLAIHELQHVEEWDPSETHRSHIGKELLTSLCSLILTDHVYKRIFGSKETAEECYMGRLSRSEIIVSP